MTRPKLLILQRTGCLHKNYRSNAITENMIESGICRHVERRMRGIQCNLTGGSRLA